MKSNNATRKKQIPHKSHKLNSIFTKNYNIKRPTGNHVWLLSGIAFILIGMVLGGNSLINSWWKERGMPVQAQILTNNKPVQNSVPLISDTPINISIPNVNINLEVVPGYYDSTNNSWTLSLNNAQWAEITARPNNKSGATFIYAHNRESVFLNLTKVKPGDEAIITTKKGYIFRYTFVNSTVTTPSDTSLFNYRGKPILVLQTCTGLWYQKRQLFYFDFINVN